MANNSTFSIAGALNASIKVGDNLYKNTHLLVTDSLVAPLIIGRDILGRHSSISVYLGGWDNKASFCASLKSLDVEQPELLPGVDIETIAPIATTTRRNIQHSAFIKTEIQRLLNEDIIQERRSPWCAQCFAVNSDTKPRLVIDFSCTINKYTFLDAYPSASIGL